MLLTRACRYSAIVAEILASVKKTEESLNRLKRMRKPGGTDEVGVSDEDKIRAQLALDIKAFGALVCLTTTDTKL